MNHKHTSGSFRVSWLEDINHQCAPSHNSTNVKSISYDGEKHLQVDNKESLIQQIYTAAANDFVWTVSYRNNLFTNT